MPVLHFTISGNAGAAGVTVAATGASIGSATSAADGTYTIGGLIAGAYTITPTLAGASFTPASASETIIAGNLTGVNFVAKATGYSPSGSVSDNFHRANAPTLGANWTVTTDFSDAISILTDAAVPSSPAFFGSENYTGTAIIANQEAAITIDTFGTLSDLSVVVRHNTAATQGYLADVAGNGDGTATYSLIDLTTELAIGVSITTAPAPAPGDVVSIQAIGTLITMFYNGVAVISATNSSTASGAPGFTLEPDGSSQTEVSVSLFTASGLTTGSPAGAGTNTTYIVTPGPVLPAIITSPRTSVMGTNLGTQIRS